MTKPKAAGGPAEPGDSSEQMRTAYRAITSQKARIAELEAALRSTREPVAIVGVGCRFPGGVRGPESFWIKLRAGFDAVREVPPERWPVDAYYDANPETPGKIYTRYGAFLDEVDRFDARFFGISPREAASMDPQQRLLLETAWEALEHAGIPPPDLAGTAAGVFVGLTAIDYVKLVYRDDLRRVDAHAATGNVANIAAGRLSYFFGLRGPAVTLDTACSSSLVAVHLACQSLRAGESSLALAAGVNLILTPDNSVAVARARMLSPGGSCRAFDAAADGYVRGEGCGVVVLKLLSRAQADGDRILAVVRGSAVGQDGARSGLTVPNGPAQAELIRRALAEAGAAPGDLGYLEAHGTGTSLGDPIEAEALARVFGGDPKRKAPLVLGSLKTNVGHMESAAGIGGLIKAVLAVRHGEIPPHLHFRRENPEVRLADIPARIPTETQPWPAGGARRLAGVSSFGSCGTIAHVLVEEAPAAPAAAAAGRSPRWLFLSAKSVPVLHELAGRTAGWLAALPADASIDNFCWTAAAGRTHFPHRLAVRGASPAELVAAITEHAEPPADSPGGRYLAGSAPDLQELFGDWRGRRVTLPSYPFARDRHWVEPEPAARVSAPRPARPPVPAAAPAFGLMFFNGSERPEGGSYRLVLEASRYADGNGFSSVWAPERHFTAFGALYPNPALLHAALARETQSVRLMAGSCVLPLHNLLRVVEEWAMVDNLSGGRAGMSFASGWNPADFALAPERYADRHDALFAGIAEVRRLWQGGLARRRGGDGREVDVRAYPTPVQRELPLWVTAAGSPRTFERAGEAGANLLTHLLDQDIPALSEKLALYRAARGRAGHDPDAGRVTVMLHTFLAADQAAVEAKARAPYCKYLEENLHLLSGLGASRGREVDLAKLSAAERAGFASFLYDRFASSRALLGTPEACAPLVRQLAEAGVDEIACLLDFGPADGDVLAMLPQLAAFKDAMQASVEVVKPSSAGAGVAGRAASAETPDCLLEVAWRPTGLVPNPPLPSPVQRWAVIGGGALGAGLTDRLRGSGQEAVQVSRAADLPEGMARIINLQPLGDGPASIGDALALVQRGRGRLWTVTRGAQPAGGTVPDPAGAALWGLLRVLPVEQPGRWGGLVDLDPDAPIDGQQDALWGALTNGSREDQLAFRGGSWLAARLSGRPAADLPAAEPLDPAAGAWLVTGGLGGLGWAVAEWLVARGARELLLLGRRGPDAARKHALEAWSRQGVRAVAAAADCADAAALDAALALWRSEGGSPISGVFHIAGAWQDAPLAELDAAGLEAVWRPKVGGAQALERSLARDPVAHWIYFSAFSALLPALGQGNYAAANAWLGAQARRQRAAGARAIALDWGPWSGTGFALTEYGRRAHERLESIGIGRLRPAEGLAVLERAVASGQPQIGAMPVDWTRLFAADPQARLSPLLAELAARHAGAAEPDADEGRIAKALAACPPSGHLALLREELRRLVGAVLHLAPGEVPPDTAFTELGVDSLMAIEIKNRLQRQAGIDVPLIELLRGPTAAGLAAALLPLAKAAALAHAAPASGPVEEIEI